jgi:hypothetical protein
VAFVSLPDAWLILLLFWRCEGALVATLMHLKFPGPYSAHALPLAILIR